MNKDDKPLKLYNILKSEIVIDNRYCQTHWECCPYYSLHKEFCYFFRRKTIYGDRLPDCIEWFGKNDGGKD